MPGRQLIGMVSVKHEYEIIKLRIFSDGSEFVAERETVIAMGRPDELSVTQIFAGTATEVEFFVADDYEPTINMRGLEVLGDYTRSLVCTENLAEMSVNYEPLSMIDSEARLIREIRSRISPIGGAFMAAYVETDPASGNPKKYVFLCGGSPNFFSTYIRKRWFAIDPFLTHAVQSNAPMYSSMIGLLENLTGSWLEMGLLAREYRLCSWGGFPTHRPRTSEFGVLYVATSTLPADGGERPLQENSAYLRGLAAEVFDWQFSIRRKRELSARKYDALDLKVLQAVAAGQTASDIAPRQCQIGGCGG